MWQAIIAFLSRLRIRVKPELRDVDGDGEKDINVRTDVTFHR